MAERTPAQARGDQRVDLSRLLRRWMDEFDITQDRLADLVGTTSQRVQRWCDPTKPEVPGASDIALFPRELGARVLRWLGEGHHLAVVDELAPTEGAAGHLSAIHRIASADAGVTTSYLAAIEDQVVDRAERADLIRRLRHSIEVERAALCRLEQDELAERAAFSRGGAA